MFKTTIFVYEMENWILVLVFGVLSVLWNWPLRHTIDLYLSRLLVTYIKYQLTLWQFEGQNLAPSCSSLRYSRKSLIQYKLLLTSKIGSFQCLQSRRQCYHKLSTYRDLWDTLLMVVVYVMKDRARIASFK